MGAPFRLQERVRWIDCDAAKIIHYAAYIRFLEIAETEMYRSIGYSYADAFERIGAYPIRAAYHCEYRIPALIDDLMDMDVWVSHWGHTSFTLSFRFTRAGTGETLAEGWCRQVTVDTVHKRPIPIPAVIRSGFAQYSVGEE